MRRLPAVLMGVLSVAVAGGLLDGIVWPGSALALFRPQLTLLLVLGALVALVLRDRRAAIAGIAIASLGGVLLIATLRDPEAEPPPAGSRTVKVLTLNLWHRNDDVAARARGRSESGCTRVRTSATRGSCSRWPVAAALSRRGSSWRVGPARCSSPTRRGCSFPAPEGTMSVSWPRSANGRGGTGC